MINLFILSTLVGTYVFSLALITILKFSRQIFLAEPIQKFFFNFFSGYFFCF